MLRSSKCVQIIRICWAYYLFLHLRSWLNIVCSYSGRVTKSLIVCTIKLLSFSSTWLKICILVQHPWTIKRMCLNLSWSVNFRSFIGHTSFTFCVAPNLTFLTCLHSFQKILIQVTFSLRIIRKLRSFINILRMLLPIFFRICMRSFIAMAHLTTHSTWIIDRTYIILVFMFNWFKRSIWWRHFSWVWTVKLYWRLFLHIVLLWEIAVSWQTCLNFSFLSIIVNSLLIRISVNIDISWWFSNNNIL